MSDHVDLVKNEWQAGYQVLIARAQTLENDLQIEIVTGTRQWEEILKEPISDPNTGQKLHPQDAPLEFLARLRQSIGGSDFFITEPHSEYSCPFREAVRLPFDP